MSTPNPFRLTRRQFLGAAGATGAGLVVGCSNSQGGKGPSTSTTSTTTPGTFGGGSLAAGTGTLVLVTLYGGNDGLDTVVPAEDGTYQSLRGDLARSPADLLDLGDGLGFHPKLERLHQRWGAGQLAVMRAAGYPEPDRSHFRSMDIWQTGEPERAVVPGWLGRWLDAEADRDPLRAVSIGQSIPRAMVGLSSSAAAVSLEPFEIPGGAAMETAVAAVGDTALSREGWGSVVAGSMGDLLTVADATGGFERSTGGGPGYQGELAASFELVADAIAAGLPTRVYAVSTGGYDTHDAQANTRDTLMEQLDAGVGGFLDRLDGDGTADDVVVLVYSEFGRRVEANASLGTDHGKGGLTMVAGSSVSGGFYGDHPSLTDLDDGDLASNVDFRSVYTEVLEQVLGIDPTVCLDAPQPALGFLA